MYVWDDRENVRGLPLRAQNPEGIHSKKGSSPSSSGKERVPLIAFAAVSDN